MKVKRLVSIMLAVAMLGGISIVPSADASGSNYEIRVLGRVDSAVQYNGRDTYTIDLQIRTMNGAVINGNWSCDIAYDTSVFELVTMAGTQNLSEVTPSISVVPGASYTAVPPARGFSAQFSPFWLPQIHVALSSNGAIGYVAMKAMTPMSDPNEFTTLSTLQTIRLAFRPGRSLADVTNNTIRFVLPSEMPSLGGVTSQILINDGVTYYEFGLRNGGANTLSTPIFQMEIGGGTQYTITATAGTGGTVSGGGTFNNGAVATLIATPNSGQSFVGWYENNVRIDGAGTTYSFSVTAHRTLEARFEALSVNTVTIDATAGAGGTVSGGGTYNEGAHVTLTATPNSGHRFDGWYENNNRIAGAGATYSFTATANRTLEARFAELIVNTFVIIASAGAGGTVSGDGTYNEGATVTLSATPDEGFRFSGWYENDVRINGAGVEYSFTATADRTLEVRFTDVLDVIVPSTSHATTARINLTTEEIFLDGITVAAFSVDGGIRWRRGTLPVGARFNRLFDRELTLVIAQELDSKRKPVGIFVVFPTIAARPRANVERLAPWYDAETWDLTKRGTPNPAENIYEWARSTNGRVANTGETWTRIVNGRCGIRIENPGVRTQYIFRTPATGDGSVARPYTPASRVFRVRPRPMAKTPNYRIDARRSSIRLRNGDWFTIADGPVQRSPGGHLELTSISTGTRVRIWRGQTGARPPSAIFELTVQ
jgi:hypothetical protein